MKILFVSNSPKQTVITARVNDGSFNTPNDYETHIYNHDGGYTELWRISSTFEEAAYMHKQLCEKCYIKVNM
jgi:hypothetical protein